MRLVLMLWLVTSCGLRAFPSTGDNLIPNGGFEQDLKGWRALWTRQKGTGTVSVDHSSAHGDGRSARIAHSGTNDWSLEPETRVQVQPGEVFELEAWVQVEGEGSVILCVSTWNVRRENLSWTHAERTARAGQGWKRLRTRFAVPVGVAEIQPRLIGYGPAVIRADDCALRRLPRPDTAELAPLSLSNETLRVELHPKDGVFRVTDRRTGTQWVQHASHADFAITQARSKQRQMTLKCLHIPSGLELEVTVEVDPLRPEFSVRLAGEGELPGPLAFPFPFHSRAGDRLVVPMNEGVSYPVEDQAVEAFRLIAYGGHGICMAFWGVTEDRQGEGHMAILETPDDAAIRLARVEGRLVVAPEWDSQKGQLGYTRKLRYIFFDRGGHVAIAKRYREHARQIGWFKTLEEKRRENPNVDMLIGAANVWNWDSDPVQIAKELQAAGITRILWSRGGKPEALQALRQMNVLTSRYDIYQDTMDPKHFPALKWLHPDWTTAAWPNDIILRADGDWQRGWGVEGKNGEWYDCGVLCDLRAPVYALQRIPAELATHSYQCRFIDTTTAAPWNECYHTNHPMTRTESRLGKMKLLDYVSRDLKLVTGCETGHDAAVPYLHYFEGMLSLGPYRVPDAGRDMQRIWDEVPDRVARFQLGYGYRLPLWELVYHDCVVAQWYWGDYNNKLPALWDKRDLFNLLYGTPPMFMFNRSVWQTNKERFVQSYRNTCPYARATGYSEMIDHRFLTPDRAVQQTAFANGVVITVNFGETPFPLSPSESIPALGFKVRGLPESQ
jgi:hypothetical protein